MKLFKTAEEKRIEQLEKEQQRIYRELDVLKKEPLTTIKRLIEDEGSDINSIEKYYESINVVIHDDGGYHYIPLQGIAVETGYFVTSYRVHSDGIHISFSTFAEIKRREALPPY